MTNNYKELEKVLKGAANHWRLKILFLLDKDPDLSLAGIAGSLDGHFKTISEHTKKLLQSGLIEKRYQGKAVLHSLSVLGRKVLNYVRKL